MATTFLDLPQIPVTRPLRRDVVALGCVVSAPVNQISGARKLSVWVFWKHWMQQPHSTKESW